MTGIKEEVAYIKGLAEGLLDGMDSDRTVKVVSRLIVLAEKMAAGIDELEEENGKLSAYIESLDGDLDRLEKVVYHIDEQAAHEGSCPSCNERFIYDADVLGQSEEIECPGCHNSVKLKVAE